MGKTTLMKCMGLLLATLMVAACHNDNLPPRLSKTQKQEYGRKLAGTYEGTYNIIYSIQGKDSVNNKKMTQATVSITDYDKRNIFFHDFPVSMLSHIVLNADLSKALAEVPNQDISAQYDFQYYSDYTNTVMSFTPNPVSLTLEYGGAAHHIVIHFGNNSLNYLFSPDDWAQQSPFPSTQWQLVFDAVDIYEENNLIQAFDFYDSYGMLCVFLLDDTND